MPDLTEQRNEIVRLVRRYESRLRIARATELVSAGQFLQAESLLSPGGAMPRLTRELDLLARIYVCQGRLDLAKNCWKEVLVSGEKTSETEDCLRVLEEHTANVFRRQLLLWRIKLALLIALLALWTGFLIHFLFFASAG